MSLIEIAGLVLLGLFAGSLAATLGVGGGIIYVPVLISVFAFGQLEAQGTSLAIILPTAVVGAVIHGRAGRVVWKVAFVAGGFGLLAAFAGARFAHSIDEETLRKAFAIVLAVLAIRMTQRSWALRPDSGTTDRS